MQHESPKGKVSLNVILISLLAISAIFLLTLYGNNQGLQKALDEARAQANNSEQNAACDLPSEASKTSEAEAASASPETGKVSEIKDGTCSCPPASQVAILVSEKNSKFEPLLSYLVALKTVKYINAELKSEQLPDLAFKSYKKEGGVYEITLMDSKTKENRGLVYVSGDGKYIFPAAINSLEPIKPAVEVKEAAPKAEAAPVQIKATVKPEVQLFVMSYCPFGLQAEKMFLPVYDLLKDKAAMGVYYVNYTMHGFTEAEQNVRQYCISSEQIEKFSKYLSCFVKTDKHADCAKQAQIDEAKLAACFAATMKKYNINDKSETFPVFDELNKKYNVQGSPTIIINGDEVQVDRSPEEFKKAICAAFTVKPKECDTILSKTVASPGIGDGTASSSGGSCN